MMQPAAAIHELRRKTSSTSRCFRDRANLRPGVIPAPLSVLSPMLFVVRVG
ncbi:BZ3500_MvSof-1268-A1-R1_Chr7-3g09589 [Microbotryum saponariae]|uniref:BZ3500_MvSof-1268-A1-R1_Chr7-3g09589 protein n=1 Tax=Microbotryum saponariae TaxID=289078 RepID=A0A2X0KZ54_9BASI|nr:BZ3501_MvSof-1269-A2-R1_Chr7-2g09312 [Microbotryum saponariae]SDA02249.1 BZ3500_MvSof-1268-A1-R1_Chr7-3g09589 [Microbotryum saponariae]